MSKRISVEGLRKHCGSDRDAIGATRSPHMKVRKNVEQPIEDIIAICGGRAQLYIENEIEGWERGIFNLTEVRYKQEEDESLLMFNFRPKKYFQTESPRVLVVFRRIGVDNERDRAGVEEFYIPFDDIEGKVSEIHYGVGNNVSPYSIDEHGTTGFDKYHEALSLEIELDDLN